MEDLFQRKDELMREFEELDEKIPYPVLLQRHLGMEPIRYPTKEDKRNIKRLGEVSRELRRIFARLEAEAEREPVGAEEE